MTTEPYLTSEMLKARLDYDPETGIFVWKHCADRSVQWNGRYAGKPAGCVGPKGYVQIRIKIGSRKILFLAHRLAWLWVHGEWPVAEIDHENGIPGNDWIDNLSDATRPQNAANTSAHVDSRSGVKGVWFCSLRQKWKAQITVNGKRISCGSHSTFDAAVIARKSAEQTFQKEFARAS